MRGSVDHNVAEHQSVETSSEPKNYHLAASPVRASSSQGFTPQIIENEKERQKVTEKQ